MIRVATIPLQRTLSAGIQQAQQRLADTQLQLNSGKKANDLAGLGIDAGRTLSARSLRSAQDAQSSSAKRLGTTLSLYDANISNIDESAAGLRQKLMTVIGTGQTAGLQGAIEGAFDQFRAALNATDGSNPLFAGAQTDATPFKPQTLSATIGLTPATAFSNDDVRASARIGDGVDMTYGVGARELGSGILSAFQTLAGAGTIGDTLSPGQIDALKTALGQIDSALPQVRAINAENGRKQTEAETLATRGEERSNLLTSLISDAEDADYGEIAMQLTQQQTVLKASYSVFTQLSDLSLTQYLR
ncbi:hypothetical protein GCM10022268_06920 [Sphingomonas cynarae]|uniref:Flagellin C-terminal domain-containing protein n=1 Tax=Sphingomonas cynarae TaxID=930197 RepID=A0ABP7D462_9SPHN